MIDSRGALTRFTAASAAVVAALAFAGAPTPAVAATSNAATQVTAAFPTGSFFLKNPSQQAKCAMPTRPSFVGPLTMQPCGDIDALFIAFVTDGWTELIPLWGSPPNPTKCLGANSANEVYTSACDSAINRDWQLVGKTVKNRASGKCLSANSANEVYTAVCDGAINRNWTFPGAFDAAGAQAVRVAGEARRAEPAGTVH